MTITETPAKPMDAIAEIVRKHEGEIIDYTENQIRFHGNGITWGVAIECYKRGYQIADVYQHWHYTDGKREWPYWLMIFNLPESSE